MEFGRLCDYQDTNPSEGFWIMLDKFIEDSYTGLYSIYQSSEILLYKSHFQHCQTTIDKSLCLDIIGPKSWGGNSKVKTSGMLVVKFELQPWKEANLGMVPAVKRGTSTSFETTKKWQITMSILNLFRW